MDAGDAMERGDRTPLLPEVTRPELSALAFRPANFVFLEDPVRFGANAFSVTDRQFGILACIIRIEFLYSTTPGKRTRHFC
jgi:hypothetical protein